METTGSGLHWLALSVAELEAWSLSGGGSDAVGLFLCLSDAHLGDYGCLHELYSGKEGAFADRRVCGPEKRSVYGKLLLSLAFLDCGSLL